MIVSIVISIDSTASLAIGLEDGINSGFGSFGNEHYDKDDTCIRILSTKEGMQKDMPSNAFAVYKHHNKTKILQISDHNSFEGSKPTSMNTTFEQNENPQRGFLRAFTRLSMTLFKKTLLPSTQLKSSSYPKGYIKYVLYNAIQDLSTQLRSIVATQRVLEGVGVGKEGATALSASINFIIRDGAGMAASLLFTAMNGSNFGKEIKRWKLFADVIVDLGIFLEVLTSSLSPVFFLPTLCFANMCKALCGVAAGSCSGAISLHWAEKADTDISEITAKSGAQNTLTGALGLIFAAVFARSISDVSQVTLWSMFMTLTAIHIFANVQSMKLISFHNLNTMRFNMLAIPFLDSLLDKSIQPMKQSQDMKHPCLSDNELELIEHSQNKIPCQTPEWVSKREPLFFFVPLKFFHLQHFPSYPIFVGVSIEDLISFSLTPSSSILTEIYTNSISKSDHGRKNLISIGRRRGRTCILISLHSNVTSLQKAKTYFHGLMLSKMMREKSMREFSYRNRIRKSFCEFSPEEVEVAKAIEKEASSKLDNAWCQFLKSAQCSGWDLNKTELNVNGYQFDIDRISAQNMYQIIP